MRPVILMIPRDTSHITLSCISDNQVFEYEYDMADIKKCLLEPKDEDYEKKRED